MLEQSGVTRHQGGRGEPDDLPEREVPGHHREDGTEGAVAHHGADRTGVADVGGVGVLVGEQRLGVLRVPAHGLGALRGLRARLGHRFAHLRGHGAGDAVLVGVEQVGGGEHPLRAVREAGAAVFLEGLVGPDQVIFDLARVERIEGLQGLAGGRVDRGDGHDQHLLGGAGRGARGLRGEGSARLLGERRRSRGRLRDRVGVGSGRTGYRRRFRRYGIRRPRRARGAGKRVRDGRRASRIRGRGLRIAVERALTARMRLPLHCGPPD